MMKVKIVFKNGNKVELRTNGIKRVKDKLHIHMFAKTRSYNVKELKAVYKTDDGESNTDERSNQQAYY